MHQWRCSTQRAPSLQMLLLAMKLQSQHMMVADSAGTATCYSLLEALPFMQPCLLGNLSEHSAWAHLLALLHLPSHVLQLGVQRLQLLAPPLQLGSLRGIQEALACL
jgi:hypothetical protein